MYFVAEIGVNHNGSVALAKKLIDAAKNSGADCVKFQSFKASKLAKQDTPKVEYQKNGVDKGESHLEMLSRLQLDESEMSEIYSYCKQQHIDFISTPYDVDSAKSLFDMGCRVFKTASADIVDLRLHRYLADNAETVVISVGMATLGEIESVLSLYQKSSAELILLHCISNYPCSDDSVNMKVMKTLQTAFGKQVGFSDHTVGSVAAVLAVSFGAGFIEKHFTLDKDLPGPDHAASSTPSEFFNLVKNCIRAKTMLGGSEKLIQSEELAMRSVSRKSVYATKSITKGEIITSDQLDAIRPGGGLSPMLLPAIEGTRALIDINKGDFIKFGDFGE